MKSRNIPNNSHDKNLKSLRSTYRDNKDISYNTKINDKFSISIYESCKNNDSFNSYNSINKSNSNNYWYELDENPNEDQEKVLISLNNNYDNSKECMVRNEIKEDIEMNEVKETKETLAKNNSLLSVNSFLTMHSLELS